MKTLGWMAAVLALAALVRAAYWRELSNQPGSEQLISDAAYHDYCARPGPKDPAIASAPYFRPPGYTYFLAAIYRIFGAGPRAARAAQMLLGCVSALLAFELGRRWAGLSVGALAGAGLAAWWIFPYYEADLLEPSLLVFLTLLSLALLWRWRDTGRLGFLIGAGLCLGFYALVRPNVLLFVAALPLWIYRVARRSQGKLAARPAWAALWGIVAVVILPVTLRNAVVGRDFVPICSNGGVNMLIGFNPRATGIFNEPEEIRPFRSAFDHPALVERVSALAGRPLKPSGASLFLARRALTWALRHPWQSLRLIGRKTLLFWGPFEVGNNREDHWERLYSPVLRALPGPFPLLLGVAVLGLALGWRERAQRTPSQSDFTALMLWFVAAYFASHLPFFVAGRFRVPVVAILMLFAAYGLDRWVRILLRGSSREAIVWSVGAAALALAASINWTGYVPDEVNYWYFRAVSLAQAGLADSALKTLREAYVRQPTHAPTLQLAAQLHEQAGRAEEAIAFWKALAEVAPDPVPALHRLGVLLGQSGRNEEAEAVLARAVSLAPTNAALQYTHSLALGGMGRTREAIEAARRAVELQPGEPELHNSLAWLLATASDPSLRDAAAALHHAQEACRLAPQPRPHYLGTLAAARAASGDFTGAVAATRQALGLQMPPELRTNLQARLERYRQGLPDVELSP